MNVTMTLIMSTICMLPIRHLAITIAVTIVVAETLFGPSNIERTEGNVNEFIPCPFDGTTTTPFWKINDTFYYHTRLPRPFIASTSPSGLLITVVEKSISGTSFQCFAAGIGPGAAVMRSSVGVLTVIPDPKCTSVSLARVYCMILLDYFSPVHGCGHRRLCMHHAACSYCAAQKPAPACLKGLPLRHRRLGKRLSTAPMQMRSFVY